METYLIDQHLEALNLRRATTIRDSCSLFRAVAQSSHVSGDQSEHLQVRLNTLTFLAENWDRMRMFFVGQLDKTAYLQQMRLETTFAGENEIRAICVRYDVCIEVFYCDLNDCSVTSQRSCSPCGTGSEAFDCSMTSQRSCRPCASGAWSS